MQSSPVSSTIAVKNSSDRWQSDEIKNQPAGKHRRFLAGRYLPVMILKSDTKGQVFKGISFKKLFKPGWCLIKQGRASMCTDGYGRDIRDRLLWQYELNKALTGIIKTPKITDCFTEKEDLFLIMDFIEGKTLNEIIESVYKNPGNPSVESQIILTCHLIAIAENLTRLHQSGYIHRDLNPENFIIDTMNEIFFIDMELVYSIPGAEPNPPFEWGTPGFMSPEQLARLTPTIHQDIYGLGGLLLYAVTGTAPTACGVPDLILVEDKLNLSGIRKSMLELILSCLEPDAAYRPDLHSVIRELRAHHSYLTNIQWKLCR